MLFDGVMGPLDKSYCVVIYAVGLFVFLSAFFALFTGIYLILFKSGDKNARSVYFSLGISTIFQSLMLFVFYYLYRIVYNICLKVL